MYVCKCTVCSTSCQGGQRMSDPLELSLNSCELPQGAGSRAWILCKTPGSPICLLCLPLPVPSGSQLCPCLAEGQVLCVRGVLQQPREGPAPVGGAQQGPCCACLPPGECPPCPLYPSLTSGAAHSSYLGISPGYLQKQAVARLGSVSNFWPEVKGREGSKWILGMELRSSGWYTPFTC